MQIYQITGFISLSKGLSMKICVVIASTGRPDVLSKWATSVERQTLKPYQFIYSLVNEKDAPSDNDRVKGSSIIFGPAGLCAQRNRGLDACSKECELVCFFDDDYIPTRFCFEHIVELFFKDQNIVGANGFIIADGINCAGISYAAGFQAVVDYEHGSQNSKPFIIETGHKGLYGCNMAFRLLAIEKSRFDEDLPLYGWQEDIDFAARISEKGVLVKTNAFAGVHLGVKGGRSSGVKLGYSQIANPLYLVKKRTMGKSYAVKIMLKNFIMNHIKVFSPESWVDRRGRLRGNWIAIFDLIRNEIHPNKIYNL